jgi:hypothetical protein
VLDMKALICKFSSFSRSFVLYNFQLKKVCRLLTPFL